MKTNEVHAFYKIPFLSYFIYIYIYVQYSQHTTGMSAIRVTIVYAEENIAG